MKKDYLWFTILGLFIFGYVLNRIAGTIDIGIRNPYLFFNASTLATYPFTAVSIGAYSLALAGTLIVAISYISKAYYIKATVLFLISALSQLYAIQQLATHGKVTPMEWTLAIAYAGALFLPTITIYILKGLFSTAHKAIVNEIQPIRHDLRNPGPPPINQS